MKRAIRHRWSVSIARAQEIQKELRGKLLIEAPEGPVRTIAGLDVAYDARESRMYAGGITFEWPGMRVLERRWVSRAVRFPYVPGYLSFREAPALAAVLDGLAKVDLLLCDGQGIAHPRGLGLASHIGVLYDAVTIGVAKTRLIGEHGPVGERRGSSRRLLVGGKWVGYVVRTRDGVRPLYVSPGHRMDADTARRWVLALCAGHRLPEPSRQAHLFVSSLVRETKSPGGIRWTS
ncbi:MAG: endonuclease V [Planctomycetota bacterium]